MSVASSELVLDEGCEYGYFDSGVQDILNDAAAGTLTHYHIAAILKVDDNPATTGRATFKLSFKYSEDNVSWTDYAPFIEGEYYCRYVRFFVEVWGDPATGQRPKITEFEVSASPVDAVPVLPPVQSETSTPPASPSLGDSWLVGASATGAWNGHDHEVARCTNSTTPAWRFIKPRNGMKVFDTSLGTEWIYQDGTNYWVNDDPRSLSTGHITILAHAYKSIGQGVWAYSIDANQALGATYANASAANSDSITYTTCLKVATYTMSILYKTTAASGILKVYHTSVSVPTLLATIDMYSAATVNNCESRSTGLAFTVAKLYDIICVVTSKNGASSGYVVDIGSISLFRTA
jgi:hypothetical protein